MAVVAIIAGAREVGFSKFGIVLFGGVPAGMVHKFIQAYNINFVPK